jgi:Lar family restriction alleviation protein
MTRPGTICLRPCPFCGCNAAIDRLKGRYMVSCRNGALCGVYTDWRTSQNEAINIWNQRVKGE